MQQSAARQTPPLPPPVAVALHRAVRVAVGDELRKLAAFLPGLSAALPEQHTVNGSVLPCNQEISMSAIPLLTTKG